MNAPCSSCSDDGENVDDVYCVRDELLSAMQRFLTAVKTLLNAFMTHQQASSNRVKLEQQLAYLTEAESTDASHPVHTLVGRLAIS